MTRARVLLFLIVWCLLPSLSSAMTYAFPNQGGVKFRGCNIPPPTAQSGEGDWYIMEYKWGTGATDYWTLHIKPAIDACAAQGANAVRMIWDGALRQGTLTPAGGPAAYLSSAQLKTIVDQFMNYLDTQGMWGFATLSDLTHIGLEEQTISSYDAYISEIVPLFTAHPNLVAIEPIQEVNYDPQSTGWYANGNVATTVTTAKAAMTASVPASVSLTANTAGDLDITRYSAGIKAVIDYADFHYYKASAPAASDLNSVLFNAGNGAAGTTDFPINIGETGVAQSVGTSAANAYYVGIVALTRPRLQGIWQWSIVPSDTNASGDYGIYDVTQDGTTHAYTTPRTGQTSQFATMPLATQAYNASEDLAPIIASEPSPTTTSTTIAVTWPTATGGTGTVTYTLQYATSDAFSFPTQTWQSASPTTSTSKTITGLSASSHYELRVKSVDTNGMLSYSQWAPATTQSIASDHWIFRWGD